MSPVIHPYAPCYAGATVPRMRATHVASAKLALTQDGDPESLHFTQNAHSSAPPLAMRKTHDSTQTAGHTLAAPQFERVRGSKARLSARERERGIERQNQKKRRERMREASERDRERAAPVAAKRDKEGQTGSKTKKEEDGATDRDSDKETAT